MEIADRTGAEALTPAIRIPPTSSPHNHLGSFKRLERRLILPPLCSRLRHASYHFRGPQVLPHQ